jgi:basic membrane protein A
VVLGCFRLAVGFIFTDDINALAKEYPNVRFADIDYAVGTDASGNPIPPPPNVAALRFKEATVETSGGALGSEDAGMSTRESK